MSKMARFPDTFKKLYLQYLVLTSLAETSLVFGKNFIDSFYEVSFS